MKDTKRLFHRWKQPQSWKKSLRSRLEGLSRCRHCDQATQNIQMLAAIIETLLCRGYG